jgi:hypothetical protein
LPGEQQAQIKLTSVHTAYIVFVMLRLLITIYRNVKFHSPQTVHYPKEGENILQFTSVQNQFPVPFCLYIDFESFVSPVKDDVNKSTHVTESHSPSGFCCQRISMYPQYNGEPFVYSGPNVMENFFKHLEQEEAFINYILNDTKPMLTPTDEENRTFYKATTCPNCNKLFTRDNPKVRHHDHVTGACLGPYCRNCNLNLKPKIVSTRQTDKATMNKYFIPVVAHNLRGYDSHLIIQHFKSSFAKKKSNKISVIPNNTDKCLSFQTGSFRFIDSLLFLNASLEKLVSSLAKGGYDQFHLMKKTVSQHRPSFCKGNLSLRVHD